MSNAHLDKEEAVQKCCDLLSPVSHDDQDTLLNSPKNPSQPKDTFCVFNWQDTLINEYLTIGFDISPLIFMFIDLSKEKEMWDIAESLLRIVEKHPLLFAFAREPIRDVLRTQRSERSQPEMKNKFLQYIGSKWVEFGDARALEGDFEGACARFTHGLHVECPLPRVPLSNAHLLNKT